MNYAHIYEWNFRIFMVVAGTFRSRSAGMIQRIRGIDPAVFVNLRANDCTWRSLCEFGEGVYIMLRARLVHTCSIKIIAYAYLTS